ncbi:MAG: gliding motility-associated C-terminal domain-containing protein [Chitinophagales bacterium]|nr:gliding motility-associated C-terminal domain-containing protein [Chitinophagales bacterium]
MGNEKKWQLYKCIRCRYRKPATPTADPKTICFGERATLTAEGSGGDIYWYSDPLGVDLWNVGDEFTTPPLSQYMPYYIIEEDPATGCRSDVGVTWVNVDNFSYVSSATVTKNPICEGETTTIKVATTDIFSCVQLLDWNFDVVEEICLPDGDTTGNGAWVADFEVGPFDEPGDYIYYVQESDGFLFCPSQQFSLVVSVVESPATPVVSDEEICEGSSVTLVADDNGDGEIVWYADAGLSTELFIGNEYTVSPTTDLTVWVTRRNGSCASASDAVTVTVNPKPATPTADPETICFGERATLTAEGSGGDIYWYSDPLGVDLWNVGDEFTTPPLSQYTPYYIIEEDPATGCRSDVGVTWVNVDNFSYVSSATVTKNPICEGETTTIKVATTDIFSCVQLLDWNFDVVEEICLPDGDTTGNGAWVADFEVGPFDEPGDYIYYVQESDGFLFCPSQQFSLVVTVLEAPAKPITTNDTICAGQLGTVRADDNGPGEIVWYWDAALTQEVHVGNVFSFPANITRSVWAVRRNGDCVSEATMATVTVNPKPETPTADPETICFGERATLTAEGSGGDIYWYSDPLGVDLWNIGDEFTTPPLSQYTPYYIIEEDPTTGCRSDVGVTWVNVDNFSYVSSATVTKNPICEGETTTIKVATTDIFSCVQLLDWNFDVVEEICLPDGDTTGNGAWVADFEVGPFDEPGDYIYYVQESDGFLFCPSQQFSLVVTVLEAPAKPITTNDTICAGQLGTVRADDNGPGEIVWYWDAALTQEVHIGNVFSFPANITRSVWAVRRTGDCVSEASMATVVVNPKPEPPVVPPVFTCAGESATLEVTDTDNGGDVYWYSDPLGVDLWNIGDEFTTPTLFQYTPYYVIREDEVTGCRSDVVATWVTVDNFTYVSGATVENNPVCTGGNAIIKVATTDIFSCVQLLDWNFDVVDEICLPDGDTTGNGAWVADFEVGPFDEPGDYIFYVQESDGFLFCPSQQLSLVVTVVDGPDAPIASNDGPACEGEDVMVTASTVPGGAYLWTGPNGFTTTEQNFVIQNVTTADAGEYFVTVTVGNCTSERASTTVVVYPTPALSAAPSSNSPICEGDTLKLFASVDNPTNIVFHWSGPNGFSSMEQNPTIANVTEVENQGFYTVYVEDTTTGCSSDPASVLVNINRVPTGITATNNGPACEGEDVQLTASYVFGATYEWSGPDGFTSSDRNPVLENVTVADEGVYSVVVSIGDCSSEPQTTEVIVHPTPIANAGVDTTIIEGSSVQLFGSGGITYEWSPSDYLDHPNLPNPVATPPIGVHVYTLTVTNEFGCKGTDQVTITVLANPKPETVNLITPNGDGINDFFTIKYLENLDNYTLAIYARGGAKLLETNNYQNDWNGTHNGKDLPDGTYWYVITSGDQVFKGAITIKR